MFHVEQKRLRVEEKRGSVNGNQKLNHMPEAVLNPQEWEAVKAASIRGVPDKELSASFGVQETTIRQRRFNDPLWKAAVNANRELIAAHEAKSNASLTKGVETASLAQKVAQKVSESAEGLSASNLLLASKIAQKGLKRASGEIDHLAIENIADVERIFKMAALAGKWSQPQVQINQAFAFGGGQEDSNIIECDMEIMEDTNNYGDSFNL